MSQRRWIVVSLFAASLFGLTGSAAAQDRLSGMPGYDQYQKMQAELGGRGGARGGGGRGGAGGLVSGGAITGLAWSADGQSFTYAVDGKNFRFDLATRQPTELPAAAPDATAAAGGRAGRGAAGAARGGRGGAATPGCPPAAVDRGRQAPCVGSADGQWVAMFRADDPTGRYGNVFVRKVDGSGEKQLTNDGNAASRLKYGSASWVYGEELSQTSAMWWSPDSKKLAFYRFDESKVKDYYITTNETGVQDTLNVEAYPKPGAPNPVPDILVYDLATGATTKIDARQGKPFDDNVLGHYVWDIRWSPDGSEIYLNRANRRQQIVEFDACSPTTGQCRPVVHEEWLTGWINTDGGPNPTFLSDNKRFLWSSERTGWNNLYLYDTSGRLINQVTHADGYEVAGIIRIDEARNLLYYTARDGDNYLKVQLHRVGLDGKNDVRLTDVKFNHTFSRCAAGSAGSYADPGAGRGGGGGEASCDISPDGKYIIDSFQTHDQPPAVQLLDASGKLVAPLAQSDLARFKQLGFRPALQVPYKAADGKTTLYAQVVFPSNFDPTKKYPALLPVYGGPIAISQITTENFVGPNPTAEYGFLIVTVSYRGTWGLGKRSADDLYQHLGITEMDDMALGVKALWNQPWFDKDRVGIYGTSYGGYTSAMQIVRHPDVFAAASASSPPIDWRNYDTVYTERYMWLPGDDANKAGYDAGSAVTYAKNLQGRLLLYFGTADNNVHNTNMMQFIRALQQAGKSFDVQVGPDQGHSGVNNARMMEFFIQNLVIDPQHLRAPAPASAPAAAAGGQLR